MALLLWAFAAVRTPDRTIRVRLRDYALPLLCFAALVAWFVIQAAASVSPDLQHPAWQAAGQVLKMELDGRISADPQATFAALLRLLAYAVAFYLAMQFSASARRRRTLLTAICISGVGYSIYGLVIQFGGYDTILWYPRWSYHESLSATFVNRNSFATYAGLILLALLGLFCRRLERPGPQRANFDRGQYLNDLASRTWPLIVAMILVFMALLLSQSRGGLLACLLALPVLPYYAGARRGTLLLAGAGVVAMIAVLLLLGGRETLERLERGSPDDALSRVSLYTATIDGIQDRPWLGHGYGSFEASFPAYRTPAMFAAEQIVDKAHNSYLEFAFEAGLPALLIMLILLGAVIWRCLRAARFERHSATASRRALAAAILVGSHALVDFSVQIPAVAVLFATMLGMGVGAASVTATRPQTRSSTADY